jgi:AcrR family transcriptional regulator
MQKRSTVRGARTRESILRTAADIASVDGLDGLTIGRLAAELEMSKSGLFAHFGSKEELQLATIDEARLRYAAEVITPGLAADRGIGRLDSLCQSFLSYVERGVFPGGCFFAAAMAEFDSKSSGPVLERAAEEGVEIGHLRATTDARQLAFELEASLLAANWYFHLYSDAGYFDRARRAIRARLRSESTATGRRTLSRGD